MKQNEAICDKIFIARLKSETIDGHTIRIEMKKKTILPINIISNHFNATIINHGRISDSSVFIYDK